MDWAWMIVTAVCWTSARFAKEIAWCPSSPAWPTYVGCRTAFIQSETLGISPHSIFCKILRPLAVLNPILIMPTRKKYISCFHPPKRMRSGARSAFGWIETAPGSGWISAFALLRGSLSAEHKLKRDTEWFSISWISKAMEQSTPLLLPRIAGRMRELALAEGIPSYCSWKRLQALWFHCLFFFYLDWRQEKHLKGWVSSSDFCCSLCTALF